MGHPSSGDLGIVHVLDGAHGLRVTHPEHMCPVEQVRIEVGGIDMTKAPEAVTGRALAYVGPSAYLFPNSVRENLLYGLKHYPLRERTYEGKALKEFERLLVRFPGQWAHLAPVPPGAATDRIVGFVDFAPTVLSLAGVPIPAHLQGVAGLDLGLPVADGGGRHCGVLGEAVVDFRHRGERLDVRRGLPLRRGQDAHLLRQILDADARGGDLAFNFGPNAPLLTRVWMSLILSYGYFGPSKLEVEIRAPRPVAIPASRASAVSGRTPIAANWSPSPKSTRRTSFSSPDWNA